MSRNAVRICPYCTEENLPWAERCKGCQGALEGATLRPASRGIHIPPSLVLGVLMCTLAFGLLDSITSLTTTGPAGHKALQVVWHKFYGSNDMEIIVGEVRNQSPAPIIHGMVVGEFYSGDGRLMRSGEASLPVDPLLPGKASPFRVSVRYHPDIQKSWFHFQTADRQQISFQR